MPVREERPPSKYGMAVPLWFILTALFTTVAVVFGLSGFWAAAVVCAVAAAFCAGAGAWRIQRGGVAAVAEEDAIETGMAPPTPYGDLGHEPLPEEDEQEARAQSAFHGSQHP